MSDDGWKWIGPRPALPVDDPPLSRPRRKWRPPLLLAAAACLVAAVVWLIVATRPAPTPPESPDSAAGPENALRMGSHVDPELSAEPNVPERLSADSTELMRLRNENRQLREALAEARRARDEPLRLQTKMTQPEPTPSVVNGIGEPASSPAAPALLTRTFHLDPAALNTLGSQRTSGDADTVSQAAIETLRQTLANAGVELSPPRNLYFNSTRGVLIVRASAPELAFVEQTIAALKLSAANP